MTSGGHDRQGEGWTAMPLVRLTAFAILLAVIAAVAALVGRASGLEVLRLEPAMLEAGDETGRYALFLQFKHESSVQTTRFTVEVGR